MSRNNLSNFLRVVEPEGYLQLRVAAFVAASLSDGLHYNG